jgi:cyclohexa-1,5-dienecarbonyl-CoA hydratase
MPEALYEHIEWREGADGAVAHLVLNRPPLNVLHIPMLEEMAAALAASRESDALKVVVCQASDGSKAFSAGVDVADHTAERVNTMIPVFHQAIKALVELEVPTVAAVDGAALGGGCEVAMACDLVVASERATFGQPEIKLAALAPVASAMLPGIMGAKRAADWLFTGRVLAAADAAQAGLVSRVVPDEEWSDGVQALLDELAGLSGAALRLAKRALQLGCAPGSFGERLDAQERLYLEELMATEDIHEGLAAFAERRPAQWENK